MPLPKPQQAYRTWIAALIVAIAAGAWCYLRQLDSGLGLTGMSRDVTWGLYIGQFTFGVGIAASAVMLVLPYYLHDAKAFGKVVLFGEFVAVSSVVACMLFIFADLGQPSRVLNVLRYASPSSIMFWDMLSLGGYLVLNAVIAAVTLGCERKDVAPPRWLRPVILISIPWAISIHTVTAFLYCGLGGRPLWFTAILTPRFLASAFASGPMLLILVLMLLRRVARVPVEDEALRKLAVIAGYAMALNVFFILLEGFTAFYSRIPEHMDPFRYQYLGIDGRHALVPWMWTSALLAVVSLVLLPGGRKSERRLALACAAAFVSLWMDKGVGMVVGGFVPSPLGAVTEYAPTAPEIAIVAGIWAVGALIATLLFRTAIAIRAYAAGNSELLSFEEVSHGSD
jgi:molybdopterin-containing oxidoreductase family membrane subunit